MILSLEYLFEQVGAVFPFNFSLDLTQENLHGAKPFKTPILAVGSAQNQAGVVCLQYELTCTLCMPCDRCLEEFSMQDTYRFEHILVPAEDLQNLDHIPVEQDKLDLAALASIDLLLSLPHKFLCVDDCLGLCTKCGENQNNNRCDCAQLSQSFQDPRFAILSELLEP